VRGTPALGVGPGNVAARLLRAVALRNLGRLDEARAEIQAVLKQQPRSTDALLQLGELYLREKRSREAEQAFRKSYEKNPADTRGLLRVHQFDKVELVRLCGPTDSPAEHEKLTAHAETVLQRLELPYRVLLLAAGDVGSASAKTYDLEVWAPGVGQWLEVSSSSTFTDFQARRTNIRYRARPGERPEFVHTLNASGVALPRTIAALLETGQQPDGSVTLPRALAPYMGADRLAPAGGA
jgi:seryl-tRNA synthetase